MDHQGREQARFRENLETEAGDERFRTQAPAEGAEVKGA